MSNDTTRLSGYPKFSISVVTKAPPTAAPIEDNSIPLEVSIVLALLFFVAFTANVFVIATFFSSFSLRRVVFNMLLLNLALACLVECVCNMLLALYYITRSYWTLGATMCSVNAFFIQLATLELTFGITIMSVQRWAAIWRPLEFKRLLTVRKQIVAMVMLWLAGIWIGLPFLIGRIEVRVFPARYSCSMGDNNWFSYGLVLTVFCYSLPVTVNLLCVAYLGMRRLKEHQGKKNKRQDLTYTELFFQETFLWGEWASAKLLVIIVIAYLVLEVPYIAIKQISQMCQCYNSTKTPPPYLNMTGLVEEPAVGVDTGFTWLRFLFPVVYPFVIFWQRKDFRRKFLSLFYCCHNNSIGDMSPRPSIHKKRKTSKDITKNPNKVKDTKAALITPVLFATSEGLHLRLYDPSSNIKEKHMKSVLNGSIPTNWTLEPQFINFFCDVEDDVMRDYWGDEDMEDATEDEIDSTTPSPAPTRRDSIIDFNTPKENTVHNNSSEKIEQETTDNTPESVEGPSPWDTDKSISTLSDKVDGTFVVNKSHNSTMILTKPKKTRRNVRFADTITIFRPLTPKFKTFVKEPNASTLSKALSSKIPRWVRTKTSNKTSLNQTKNPTKKKKKLLSFNTKTTKKAKNMEKIKKTNSSNRKYQPTRKVKVSSVGAVNGTQRKLRPSQQLWK